MGKRKQEPGSAAKYKPLNGSSAFVALPEESLQFSVYGYLVNSIIIHGAFQGIPPFKLISLPIEKVAYLLATTRHCLLQGGLYYKEEKVTIQYCCPSSSMQITWPEGGSWVRTENGEKHSITQGRFQALPGKVYLVRFPSQPLLSAGEVVYKHGGTLPKSLWKW